MARRIWILAPLLFTFVYFSMFLYSDRFSDENVAIVDGDLFIQSLLSTDSTLKIKAADFNGGTSIGLPIALPAGIAFRIFGDIAAPRALMGLWSFFFWWSATWFFLTACTLLKNDFFQSPFDQLFWSVIYLCLIQAIPYSYFNQSTVLSEFPGAAFLLLSFTWFLKNKKNDLPIKAMIAGGVALSLKPNYLVFLPAIFFIGLLFCYKNKNTSFFKGFVHITIAYFSIPLLIQLLKIVTYGLDGYFSGWHSLYRWISTGAGSGLSNLEPINEWLGYHWRTQAYYILGTLLPAVSLAYLLFQKKLSRGQALGLASIAIAIFIGSAQWYFMADYKWWRRALYFIVPGYTIGIATLLFSLQSYAGNFYQNWPLKQFSLKKIIYHLVVLLALYIQVRQSIYPIFELHRPLTVQQRTAFDWNNVDYGTHR